MKKYLFLIIVFLIAASNGFGQNSLNSGDFVGGSWGVGQAMSASAGGSLIITKAVSSAGDKYFRFYGDGSPCGEYQPNSNGDFFTHSTTVTTPNGNCGSSNAWRINVPTSSSNVVFKTDGGNDGIDRSVAFVIQGTPISVSSVSQNPTSGNVNGGSNVVVTATLSGSLPTGQAVYLRYTKDAYSTSTVTQMTGSATTYTATIPASFHNSGSNVSYYVFTSGDANVSSNGSNADFYTINLNNNSGSNYTYTVSTTFFSTGSVAPNTLTNWKPNRDGSGTSPANFTSNNVTYVIQNGHSMTTSSTWAISGTGTRLQVENGGILTANNAITISTNTTFQLDNGSTYNHNHTGAYASQILQGIENFHSNSNFVINSTSTTGPGTPTTGFGNLTYAATANMNSSGNLNDGASSTGRAIQGNLTVTGNNFRLTGTANCTATIGGNLNISTGGVFALCTSTGLVSLSVNGNVNITGGTLNVQLGNDATNSKTLNIYGNLNISSGTLEYQTTSTSCNGIINLFGNLDISGGALQKSTAAAGTAIFNFSKTGTQTYLKSGGTISSSATSPLAFNINSSSIVDFGTSILDGTNPTFTVVAGGGIITANTNATGALTTSGANGTIQVTGTRTYSTSANYTFNGTAAQVTGNGFTGANNLTIDNSAASPAVTLSTSATVTGNLTLTAGQFRLGGSTTFTYSGNNITRASGTLDANTNTSSALTFTNASPLSIPASTFLNVRNLTINGAGGVTINSNVNIGGTATFTSGTLNANGFTLGFTSAVTSITRTSGNIDASGASSIVSFTNTNPLTLPANLFTGNITTLILNGAGGVTLGSATTVSTTLTLTNGTLTLGGNTFTYSGSGTSITKTSGFIDASDASAVMAFTNTTALTLPASLFTGNVNTLTINGSGGVTLGSATTVSNQLNLTSGVLTNGSFLTMGDGATINRSAGSLSAVPTFGTTVNITYSNTSNINTGNEMPYGPSNASILNNLTFNCSGGAVTVTLQPASGGIQINGTLALSGTSTGTFGLSTNTVTFGANATITRTGSMAINASNTSAVLNFTNSNLISLPNGALQTTVTNLTINGAGGIALGNANSVTITLNLTNGNIILNSSNLTVGPNTVITGGSATSHIVTNGTGKVLRLIANTGGIFTFPIGRDETTYNPVTITNNGGTNITYTVGAAGTTYSPVDNGANAQWSITSNASTTSDLAFQWLTADAGTNLNASPSSGKAYQYNGSTWDNRGGTTTGTPNTTTVTGITDLTNPTWTVAMIPAVADIAISANAPAAGNIVAASTNNIIYGKQIVVTTANTSLTDVTVNTTGTDTYAASAATDLTNFKLWINTTNSLSGATQLGSTITNAPALGGTLAFTSGSNLPYNVTTATGTYYLFVTCDVASGAVPGRLITISSTAFSNINFSSGNKTGTDPVAAGNTQTIIAVPSVTTNAASSIATTSVVLNGTVNANANSTVASFDYGTIMSYGTNVVADQSPVTGTSNTSISKTVTGLNTNTLYNYRAKGVNDAGTTNGSNATFTTLSNAPTVGIGDNATAVGFRANWTAPTNDGSEAITYTVEVDDDNTFASVNATENNIATTNFTFITLNPGTTYYYRVRAVNAGGNSAWSAVSAGIATTSSTIATVTTAAISSITVNSASGGGEVVIDGGDPVTERGIVFNTTGTPTTADTKVTSGTGVGTFTANLSSLSTNTTYYVRAYAINGVGTAYGNEVNFTTLAAEPTTQSTVAFGTRTNTSLVVNFTGGNGARRVVFIKQGSAVDYTPTDAVVPSGINTEFGAGTEFGSGNYAVYDGTGTNVTVTGLIKNTTYYIAVYEYNNNSASLPNYFATAGTGSATTYNPTITPTGTISAFGNVVTGTNSSSQSYTVEGTELAGSITITAPTGFAISLDDIDFSVNPIILAKNGSDAVPTTTIYVRFSPASATGATGSLNITHTSTDATTQNVAVSGNAIAIQPTTEGSISFGTITTTSIVVNLPTVGNGGKRIIVVKAGSAVDANPADATSYIANATFGSGTQIGTGNYVVYNDNGSGSNIVTVTGLSVSTTYHFAVFEYNEGTGTSQNYLTPSTVIDNQQTNNVSSATDAFRTVSSGNWNSTSTWESFSSGSWTAATLTPDANASAITIRNTHEVTIPNAVSISADDITVDAGGQITIASGGTLTVANGAAAPDLTVNGYLKNSGTLTLTGTATISGSSATYEHNLNNINPPAFTWASNATLRLTGTYTGTGTNPTGRLSAGAYQNIIYEGSIASASDYVSFGDNAVTIAGKLTVNGSGSGALLTSAGGTANLIVAEYEQASGVVFVNRNGGSARTLTVTGNATISGGTMFVKTVGNASTGQLIVGGNLLIQNAGIRLCLNNQISADGTGLVTVAGDVNIETDAIVQLSATITAGSPLGRLQVGGDLNVDAGATLTNAATFGFANVDFTSTTTQQFNMLGTFSTSTPINITMRVIGGGTVTLNNPVSFGNVLLISGTIDNASNLTVIAGSTVTRTAGSFNGSPTYGGAVNVTFNGTANINSGSELTPASGSIGTLTVNSTNGNTYTLSNNVSVAAVTLTAGTLDVSTSNYSINVSGNWTRTGGFFTAQNGTVTFNGTTTMSASSTAYSFNNITVAAASSLSTGAINIRGNLVNNNSFTATGAITFNGTANQSISGAGGTTTFTTITINNTGTPFATNGIVEVTTSVFTANAGFLTLTAGVFKLSGSFSFTNTFFSTAGYTIPASTGLWLNNANATVTGQTASPTISGLLRISNGSYTVGTASGNSMTSAANGAAITIEGGTFTVQGRLGLSHTVNYTQTGGTVTVANLGTSSSSIASFDISNSSSSFTMSGGSINLVQANGNAANLDYRVAASTVSISGGTLNIGTTSTSASVTFGIQGAIPNLVIDNTTNTKQADIIGVSTINGNLTINTGSTLNASSQSFTITGNFSNSGTFTHTGSTVTFNGSTTQTLTGTTTFNNVILSGTGGVNFGSSSIIGANGTLQLNSGGFVTGNAPEYASTATLIYNNTGSYNRTLEWSATSGKGYPGNVLIQNGTTVNTQALSSDIGVANHLTLGTTGSAGSLNMNSATNKIIVGGNVQIGSNTGTSTLTLSSVAGGDIKVGGNWTRNANGVFTSAARAIFFTGSGTNELSATGGESVGYLVVEKTGGSVKMLSNLTITADNAGTAMSLPSTASFDLNGNTLLLNGTNQSIILADGGVVNFTGAANSTIEISNAIKTVATSNNGTVVFGDNVLIAASTGINFGNGLSTVNGIFRINGGGFVQTNPPVYGPTSTLQYNSGSTYGRFLEWSANSGAGYPANVQLSNNTTLNYPNTGAGAFSTNLSIAGNLTIDNGSALYLGFGDNGNKSGALTVAGNVTVNGPLGLGNATGGNLLIGGNWTRAASNADFFPNGRQLIFNGTGAQSISRTGGETFANTIVVNKASGVLTANNNITFNDDLTLMSGTIDDGGHTLTVNGNIVNTGTHTSTGSGKLVMNGTSKTISGATLGNVEIASSTISLSGNPTINGVLTLTNSLDLASSSRTLTLSNTSTVEAGTNQLIGTGTVNVNGIFKTARTQGFSGANTSIPSATVNVGAFSTVEYTATAAQTITARTDYAGLTIAGASVKSLSGNTTVAGTLLLTNSDDLLSLGANTFTLNGTITGSGRLRGGATSNLVLGGTGSLGTLSFDQSTDGTTNVLNNFTLNRTSSGAASLGNKLVITNVYTPTAGVLTTNNHLHLRSTVSNTARIAAGSSGGGYITGDVTVERYMSATLNEITPGAPHNRAWRMLTPGVTTSTTINANWQEGKVNTSISTNVPADVAGYGVHITGAGGSANGFDVTQTNAASLYRFDQSAQGWALITNTNVNTLDAKQGYLLFVRGNRDNLAPINTATGNSNVVIRARGTLLQGTQTFSGLATANNFSLVTNPFASPINWTSVYTGANATNFNSSVTIWDPNIGTRGGFVTVNSIGISSSGESLLTEEIQSGQAFFIQTQTGVVGNPSFTIEESHKSTTNNLTVFRTSNQLSKLKIQLRFTASNVQRTADGVVAVFGNSYSNGLDGNDAEQVANWDEDIALSRNGKDLSIESRNTITANDTLYLKIGNLRAAQATYSWLLQPEQLNAVGLEAFLQDNFTNTTTPISLTAATTINFTVSSNAASTAANRFSIVFRNNAALPVTITQFAAQEKDRDVALTWQTAAEQNIAQYEVERSNNAQEFTKIATVAAKANATNNTYTAIDARLTVGTYYYRLRIVEKDGKYSYSKVVPITVGKGIVNTLSIYPNPIKGSTINLQLNNVEKGNYVIRVYSIIGQLVYHSSLEHKGGSLTKQMVLAEALSSGSYRVEMMNEKGLRMVATIMKE